MTGDERNAYVKRVGEWLKHPSSKRLFGFINHPDAQIQDIMQLSTMLNDSECRMFEEGAQLLSAVVNSQDTWLPDMLYAKTSKRVIRRMKQILEGIWESNRPVSKKPEAAKVHQQTPENPHKVADHPTSKTPTATIPMEPTGTTQPITDGSVEQNANVTPVRPKHIDQYVHLLPKKTQEHAAKVKDLLHELDSTREKLRLLMDDKQASPADREVLAKKAVSIDTKVRKIYDELDVEWDKLVKAGRVVVDDLGNARVVPNDAAQAVDPKRPVTRQLTSEQKAKRRDLRKMLVDKRRGNGSTRDKYIKKWLAAFDEFLALEGPKAFDDKKILEAAKHYGIELAK